MEPPRITAGMIKEFVGHPVWHLIERRLRERQEALTADLLSKPLEQVPQIRAEINAISRLLEGVKDLEREAKDDTRQNQRRSGL